MPHVLPARKHSPPKRSGVAAAGFAERRQRMHYTQYVVYIIYYGLVLTNSMEMAEDEHYRHAWPSSPPPLPLYYL